MKILIKVNMYDSYTIWEYRTIWVSAINIEEAIKELDIYYDNYEIVEEL